MRHLARAAWLLLLCLPLAAYPQDGRPAKRDWQFTAEDAHLRVSVVIPALSEQRYEIKFKNVGAQALLVPTGFCLFFHLHFNLRADGSLGCGSMLLVGGVDDPNYKHLEQIEVTTLSPGESIAFHYAQPGTENLAVKLGRQHMEVWIGYVLLEADEDIEGISFDSFLRNAREIYVFQHTEGEPICGAAAYKHGYHGGLELWTRE